MNFIGIDPGKSGAYAMICTTEDGKPYGFTVHPWDDAEFVRWIQAIKDANVRTVACVEKVGAFSNQGVKSMFTFGHSLGFIEGALQACDIPYQLIPPATWKREFSLIHADKAKSIEVCKKLFPTVDLKRTDKCRKDSDGLAEAVLMAEYARRKM